MMTLDEAVASALRQIDAHVEKIIDRNRVRRIEYGASIDEVAYALAAERAAYAGDRPRIAADIRSMLGRA